MRVLNERDNHLIRELVKTDFKLRYQGSVLGYFWSLMKPLFMFGVLYTVFVRIFQLSDTEHAGVYLLLGIVLWTFFIESTNMGLGSIVGRGDLIRKVSIPKYTIVLASSFSAFVNLCFNLLAVGVFMVFSQVALSFSMLLLPLLVLELFIFATAISYILAALYVKFRDIAYIWEVVVQALFYATPLIYTLQFVTERTGDQTVAKILLLNPLAQIIQDARYVVVTKESLRATDLLPMPYRLVPFLIVILTGVIAFLYFRKASPRFAEDI